MLESKTDKDRAWDTALKTGIPFILFGPSDFRDELSNVMRTLYFNMISPTGVGFWEDSLKRFDQLIETGPDRVAAYQYTDILDYQSRYEDINSKIRQILEYQAANESKIKALERQVKALQKKQPIKETVGENKEIPPNFPVEKAEKPTQDNENPNTSRVNELVQHSQKPLSIKETVGENKEIPQNFPVEKAEKPTQDNEKPNILRVKELLQHSQKPLTMWEMASRLNMSFKQIRNAINNLPFSETAHILKGKRLNPGKKKLLTYQWIEGSKKDKNEFLLNGDENKELQGNFPIEKVGNAGHDNENKKSPDQKQVSQSAVLWEQVLSLIEQPENGINADLLVETLGINKKQLAQALYYIKNNRGYKDRLKNRRPRAGELVYYIDKGQD